MKSLNYKYLSRLDHLRLFAALLVVFHHFRGNIVNDYNINAIPSFSDIAKVILIGGSTGVSLFLVLSAFLFTLISDSGNKKIIYKKFIFNRVLRIFPLTILLLLIVITINRANSTPMDILRLLTLQLNTGNAMTGWGHDIFPSGPIWTIAVEFQFYLIFPFLIFFLRESGVLQIIYILIFFILIRYITIQLNSPDIYYNFYHSILGRMDQFLIGILLGYFYTNKRIKVDNIQCIIIIFLSITGLLILFKLNQDMEFRAVLGFPLEAICWAGIIISYLSFRFDGLNPLSRVIAFLGGLSFSMYLLHLPIGLAVNQIFNLSEPNSITESILQTCFRLAFIIPISLLSYLAIEKPFMKLRVKYLIK